MIKSWIKSWVIKFWKSLTLSPTDPIGPCKPLRPRGPWNTASEHQKQLRIFNKCSNNCLNILTKTRIITEALKNLYLTHLQTHSPRNTWWARWTTVTLEPVNNNKNICLPTSFAQQSWQQPCRWICSHLDIVTLKQEDRGGLISPQLDQYCEKAVEHSRVHHSFQLLDVMESHRLQLGLKNTLQVFFRYLFCNF